MEKLDLKPIITSITDYDLLITYIFYLMFICEIVLLIDLMGMFGCCYACFYLRNDLLNVFHFVFRVNSMIICFSLTRLMSLGLNRVSFVVLLWYECLISPISPWYFWLRKDFKENFWSLNFALGERFVLERPDLINPN